MEQQTDTRPTWLPAESAHLEDLPPGAHTAELLARMGACLSALRVELFRLSVASGAELEGWWTGSGSEHVPAVLYPARIPLSWFPWSIGEVEASDFVFARDARLLPALPGNGTSLGDLGIGAALHLPIFVDGEVRGAVCAYWPGGLATWPEHERHKITEWATTALLRH